MLINICKNENEFNFEMQCNQNQIFCCYTVNRKPHIRYC